MSVTFLDNKDKEELVSSIGALSKEKAGAYELIETIMVEDDNVTVIDRDVSTSGEKYNFNNVVVLFEFGQTDTALSLQVSFYTSSEKKQEMHLTVPKETSATQKRVCAYICDICNDMVLLRSISPSFYEWVGAYMNANPRLYKANGDKICKIRMKYDGGFKDKKVEIYGVRA